MGRPKKQYPLGKYRLKAPKNFDKDKTYLIELEYIWNREYIRKSSNIYVKVEDWDPKSNQGIGGIKARYGAEHKRLNNILIKWVREVDCNLAEYNNKYPNRITSKTIRDFLNNKPLCRKDEGKDFVDFVLKHLDSEYRKKKIKFSRLQNGMSCMKIFKEFLISTGNGTYKEDGIYLGEITDELIVEYIEWRRKIKGNKDVTINHSLTPIIKACQYASETGLIDIKINSQIKKTRIVERPSLEDESVEFEDKYLTEDELWKIATYHSQTKEKRQKEFIEMFLFAFHACGLRAADITFLQWAHIDFEKKELRKILIKTGKRHTIPLTDSAIQVLNKWKEKCNKTRFVFNLAPENINLDEEEELYKARNNAEKCINQSLAIIGKKLGLKLSFHVARHSFAVRALNNGINMSIVSRLLGHASTDVTEKVYAKFLPETLANEVEKIKTDILPLL